MARLLVAMAVVAGCVGVDDPAAADQWAVSAQEWRAAFYEAGSEGRPNVLVFLAEDVVFEDRIVGGVIRGRQDYLRHGRSGVADIGDSQPLDMFVSADGFLDQYYWDTPFTVDMLDRVEMRGPVATAFVAGGSVASGRVHAPDLRDFAAIEGLVDRYVALWNNGGEIATVYADDASIDDTLLGLSVTGTGEIADVVGSTDGLDPPPLHVADLPEHPAVDDPPPVGARAIYVAPSDVDPSLPDEVRVVVEADDGSGCPGLMAVSMEVEGDRILAERRYHDVTSVRACRNVASLQPGWWNDIEIPDPVPRVETEPMVWPERGITVQVYNGTPEATAFVRWGLEQFDDAGLGLPDIGSVTFLVKATTCQDYFGFYGPGSESAAITLCRTVDQTCEDAACTQWRPVAGHTLLHEYAHAWMRDNLDEDTRQEFLQFSGLARWDADEDDWAERGMEQAANVIAYGLLEEPRYRGATCEQSLAGFRLLTGQEPLTSCP